MATQHSERVIAYWSRKNLTRWKPQAFRGVNIPEPSKAFLVDVGLPSPDRIVGLWYMTWTTRMPPVQGPKRRWLLGGGYSPPFLIDEETNGAVLIGANQFGDECYLNASVEQFAACVTELDRFVERNLSYDDPEIQAEISGFEQILKEIDASTVADSLTEWSRKIDDWRHGF